MGTLIPIPIFCPKFALNWVKNGLGVIFLKVPFSLISGCNTFNVLAPLFTIKPDGINCPVAAKLGIADLKYI